jgi:replicative DNA helicase
MHKPPHDLDAEKAIIGVALLDTDRARATDLTADQFYAPAHGHIWHA